MLKDRMEGEKLMSADLQLMHLQRERQVGVIFREHKARQEEIYGMKKPPSPGKSGRQGSVASSSIMDEFMPLQSIYDKAIQNDYVDEKIEKHKQTSLQKSIAQIRIGGFGGQKVKSGPVYTGPKLETIVVMLFQVRNIVGLSKLGKCDPWVLLEYNGQSRRSPVIRGTHNPHFNVTFRFPYFAPRPSTPPEACDMRITVFCSEPSPTHEGDLVGTCSIKVHPRAPPFVFLPPIHCPLIQPSYFRFF